MKSVLSQTILLVVSCCLVLCHSALWRRPGCHKVGHTRLVSIPDCVEFNLTTNACRGFCESMSVPSSTQTLQVNPHQSITSFAECCNMIETENVEVDVSCLDGLRTLYFKSAVTCDCYHCKKINLGVNSYDQH
uniref:Glycoprotein hormone alpha-2 n=1 Tax=Cacopsylla melanoneura TaxID=428564 RepID=A0A8D9E4I6_9HEMI